MMLEVIRKHVGGTGAPAAAIHEHLLQVCRSFIDSGMADAKFMSELTGGTDQQFWSCLSEALIAHRLQGRTLGPHPHVGMGPDLLLARAEQRVWIEIVCPGPVDVPAEWTHGAPGVVHFPHEQILLRWTSAIMAKANRLLGTGQGSRGYLQSGIVGPTDAYVIAVNACRLRSGPFSSLMGISQFPFAVEAVFPVGPHQIRLAKETLDVVGGGHQYRTFVNNKNAAKVQLLTFTNPAYSAVSAIWGVDFNGGAAIGNSEPAVVVHNPFAANPVPLRFLPADAEYIAERNEDEFILTRLLQAPQN